MSSDISTLVYLSEKYKVEDAGEIYDMQDAASAAVDIIETLEGQVESLTKKLVDLQESAGYVIHLLPYLYDDPEEFHLKIVRILKAALPQEPTT